MKHELSLPRRFYEDHADRELPCGTVLSRSASRVRVICSDAELEEIESDARHYAHPDVAQGMGREYSGIVASARATVKAIEAYRSNL